MISATTGWALVRPSNPNRSGAQDIARTANGGRWITSFCPAGPDDVLASTRLHAWDRASAGSQGVVGRDFYLTADGGQSWTAARQGELGIGHAPAGLTAAAWSAGGCGRFGCGRLG